MISTYIEDHNLGAQPCKSTTGNWQEANNVVIIDFFCQYLYLFRVKDQYKANPEVIVCLLNKIVHKAMH